MHNGKCCIPTLSGGDPLSNDEVTRMEHRRNDSRERIVYGDRDQGPEDHREIGPHDPRRGEEDRYPNATGQTSAIQASLPKREATSSWDNWQSVLYVLVLGATCLVLVSLTSLWWIVPVLGAIVPIALAMLDGPDPKLRGTDDKKSKERELLKTLAERGEITSATAAMHTSLTVDEASKMLDGLAGKGHLKFQVEDGIMAYALPARDRRPEQSGPSQISEPGPEEVAAPKPLDEPLSERELEILTLLASGRTNAEIAKDLFVAVGTVKSHVNSIYRKLDAANRAEAVTRAREMRLLS